MIGVSSWDCRAHSSQRRCCTPLPPNMPGPAGPPATCAHCAGSIRLPSAAAVPPASTRVRAGRRRPATVPSPARPSVSPWSPATGRLRKAARPASTEPRAPLPPPLQERAVGRRRWVKTARLAAAAPQETAAILRHGEQIAGRRSGWSVRSGLSLQMRKQGLAVPVADTESLLAARF